jgi:spore germination protein D
MIRKWISLFTLLVLLTACGGGGGGGSTQGDAQYETTKKMVVDIIKTDEGKKALTEVLTDEKMKQQLIMDSATVKDAISQTLTSEEGKKIWTKLFEDPTFVQTYTKSVEDAQKKLMKGLMTDSEYQKLLIDIFQNPEMTNTTLEVLKSQQFREHLEKTIQETLNSPLFKAKMTEVLLKAAEEQSKQQGGQSQEQSGSGGGSGQGGDSGGGSGGGSGS